MTIKITAEQLSMRFKERVLFHIPELAIGPNDAIYLKGDNGVGKTTLLKILAGLLKPSTGDVVAPKDTWLKKTDAPQRPCRCDLSPSISLPF